MSLLKNALALTLAVGTVGSLAACDSGEDNLEFEVGSTLTIVGDDGIELVPTFTFSADTTITATDTTYSISNVVATPEVEERDYFVQAFTLNRQYTWTYQGSAVTAECDGSTYPCLTVRSRAGNRYTGEFAEIRVANRGDYVSTVSTGGVDGDFTTEVIEPAAIAGCRTTRPRAFVGQPVTFIGIAAATFGTTTVDADFNDDPDSNSATNDDVVENIAVGAGRTFSVSRTFARAGEYTVELTASNEDGTASGDDNGTSTTADDDLEGECTVTVEVLAPADPEED